MKIIQLTKTDDEIRVQMLLNDAHDVTDDLQMLAGLAELGNFTSAFRLMCKLYPKLATLSLAEQQKERCNERVL